MNRRLNTVIFIALIVISGSSFAQQEPQALKLYKEGVKQFREGKYESADALFTSSLALHVTANTYFGRGAARYNISNVRGYCADMSKASYYGDAEAKKQFAGKCVVVDTMFNDTKASQEKLSKDVAFEEFTRGIYNDITIVKPHDRKGNLLAEYLVYKKDTTFTDISGEGREPQPQEGLDRLETYFENEMKYPEQAKSNGITGTVYIEFIVAKNGSLSKIKLGRGIGYGCDKEALRLVSTMAKWINGSYLGAPVKSLVELPIEFNSK